MLLDGRIVYIGMPVSSAYSYGFLVETALLILMLLLLSAGTGGDRASCRRANVSSVA